MRLSRYLPFLRWVRFYDAATFGQDLAAAAIVTIMLVPQSLAYALLAGLPPEMGLYASILPLAAYAVFGTSSTLAVGPVAIVSLMTASAVGAIAEAGTADYVTAAVMLAMLSGAILILMGVLRLGFVANFLSHPVVAGFITASALVIALSQLRHLLGIELSGHTLPELATSLAHNIGGLNVTAIAIGVGAVLVLFWVRTGLAPALHGLGLPGWVAGTAVKAAPIAVVAVTTAIAYGGGLDRDGLSIVGTIPAGLPELALPSVDPGLIKALIVPALLISLIGFVESISIAQTLAAKRGEAISPDHELVGLGSANIASAFSGGFAVTGGFARSVVNFDAGARTPAAGIFAAFGIALVAYTLTPLLHYLPKATLAATIVVAVLSLADFSVFRRTWRYSKADFAAVATTFVLTLALGVEIGVASGIALSVLLFLYRTSRPHIAEVGRVPGTQHFRNILRHDVEICASVISLRVDASLYFANTRYLEAYIDRRIADAEGVRHVVLMCSAVNEIDSSALDSLCFLNGRLMDRGCRLHLSEVKGPVMDRLARTSFLDQLTGEVFLSQHDAIAALCPEGPH